MDVPPLLYHLFIGTQPAKLRYDRRMSMSGSPPTWDDARGFLRERFALAKDGEDLVALAWVIPIEGHEITQWVRVSPLSVQGEPWLMILADICAQERLAATAAFEYLNHLHFGALLVWNGHYLFRHTVALEWFALSGLEHLVRRVAHEAVRLRLALVPSKSDDPTPPKSEEQALSHYDE